MDWSFSGVGVTTVTQFLRIQQHRAMTKDRNLALAYFRLLAVAGNIGQLCLRSNSNL